MSDQGQGAGKIENVIIAAGPCTVTLMPDFGGKIASIRFDGSELLQEPLIPVDVRSHRMSFDEADASGWDECLPSVAECCVALPEGGEAEVPDHGDLWRVEWESGDQGSEIRDQENGFTMTGACFSLPLALTRTISFPLVSDDSVTMSLDYRLTNTGSAPVPWSWAAHPLFTCDAGDRIVLPPSVRTLTVEGSGGLRLGQRGDKVYWPVVKLPSGETDLSIAEAPDAGIGEKLFAGPLDGHENWAELVRPRAGVRIRFSFDAEKTPYLGLWLCYGGWPDRPGKKQVCVALEPTTAPVDSLAETGPWTRTLDPGAHFEWPMQVEIQRL